MNKGMVGEAYDLIVRKAVDLGLDAKGKMVSFTFGEKWMVKINGNKDAPVDAVPPFHAMVLWNGWPAAILSPFDGMFVAHANVNEDMFIADLKKSFGGESSES